MGCAISSPKGDSVLSPASPSTGKRVGNDTAATYRVLVLRNAITGVASFSNKGVNATIDALKKEFAASAGQFSNNIAKTSIAFIERDLVKDPCPFLSPENMKALYRGESATTPEQHAVVALSDALIAELKSVDLVLIGLPRYNFGTPVSFKNYLDTIIRPRVTFKYNPDGSQQGLLPSKLPVWLVMSAGAVVGNVTNDLSALAEAAVAAADGNGGKPSLDYYAEWLTTVLGFIGLKKLTFLPIEGVNMSAEGPAKAMAAHEQNTAKAIDQLKASIMSRRKQRMSV